MSLVYVLEKQGKRYYETDKMAVAQLCYRHGYQLVTQMIHQPAIKLLPQARTR